MSAHIKIIPCVDSWFLLCDYLCLYLYICVYAVPNNAVSGLIFGECVFWPYVSNNVSLVAFL
jgi:hypothetical protein